MFWAWSRPLEAGYGHGRTKGPVSRWYPNSARSLVRLIKQPNVKQEVAGGQDPAPASSQMLVLQVSKRDLRETKLPGLVILCLTCQKISFDLYFPRFLSNRLRFCFVFFVFFLAVWVQSLQLSVSEVHHWQQPPGKPYGVALPKPAGGWFVSLMWCST